MSKCLQEAYQHSGAKSTLSVIFNVMPKLLNATTSVLASSATIKRKHVHADEWQ